MSAIGADVLLPLRGDFSSGCSSRPGGEIVGWIEESETSDGNITESDSIWMLDDGADEEELARDMDETVEEMVGGLYDGEPTTLDTLRRQTNVRLRGRLLGQELMRTTERRMRPEGTTGGHARHQGRPWRAPTTVDGPKAIQRYNEKPPRNILFPAHPASPAVPDGGCGYQARGPEANLCYPMQWRMFHSLDSNWLVQGRDGVETDNSAAANNEKQWALERSITLGKNYTAFNGQGHNAAIEGYPLQASTHLVGGRMRPLKLGPRDAELLSTLDPAASVRYAFEHPRMSLGARSQSQRGRKLFKFEANEHIDSRLGMNPSTPTPPAAAMRQQSEVDAQLHGEAGTFSDVPANPKKGFHTLMAGKEKPPFPTSPPLPPATNRSRNSALGGPTSGPRLPRVSCRPPISYSAAARQLWRGRNLFEGLSAAAELVRLQDVEGSEKGPFPLSPPAPEGPRLTPSEPPTPSAIFGPPAAPAGSLAERARATPETTQDVVWTAPDWEGEAARFQTAATVVPPIATTPPLESASDGRNDMSYPLAMPGSSSFLGRGGEARVLMPTVPQTRRVADKAIRAARWKPSFLNRGRKPMY